MRGSSDDALAAPPPNTAAGAGVSIAALLTGEVEANDGAMLLGADGLTTIATQINS